MQKISQELYSLIMAMIIAVIIIVAIVFSSCITQERRARICAKCPIKETVKDSTGNPEITQTPFDTAAWISQHTGKELHFKDCPELDAELVSQHTITATQDGIKEEISDGPKGITFKCETDSLKEIIKLLKVKVSTPHYVTITKEVAARCDKEHRTDFDGWCRWWFWITAGLLGLRGGIWLIKNRAKLPI